MTLLREAIEQKKFDVRVVERNTSRGVVESKEVAKTLKSLPDDGENAEWTNVDELHSLDD